MSDPSIGISAECREISYQGTITGPTEFIQLGSSIATAGLVAGDQILAINGRPVRELALVDWRAEWAKSAAAVTLVQLRVRRSGSEIELPVPVGERVAVEGQLPQIFSFQCENPRGELSSESLFLAGPDCAFIRVGDNAWQRVTKGSSERFVVGLLDGRVGVRGETAPDQTAAAARPSAFTGPRLWLAAGGRARKNVIDANLVGGPFIGLGAQWFRNLDHLWVDHIDLKLFVRSTFNFEMAKMTQFGQEVVLGLESNSYASNGDVQFYAHANPLNVLLFGAGGWQGGGSLGDNLATVLLLGALGGVGGMIVGSGLAATMPGGRMEVGFSHEPGGWRGVIRPSIFQLGVDFYRHLSLEVAANTALVFGEKGHYWEFPIMLNANGSF